MQPVQYSWISVHLARLTHRAPISGFHAPGPGPAAEWRLVYDAPLGADGWRVPETDIWGGLAFYDSRAQAEAALSASETDLPFSGLAVESWHGLMAVVMHRGYVDYSLDGETRPVFAPLDHDPGGVFSVITSGGYESRDESQTARIKEFIRQNEGVRAFYGSLGSNIAVFPFNMVGTRDGMTFSIWRSEEAMLGAAYGSGDHRRFMEVHRRTPMTDHTSFTRLRLLQSRGTWQGADLMAAAG